MIWDRKVGIISRLLAVNQGIMFWFPVYVRDYYISRSVIPSLRLTRTLHQYKLQFKYSRLNSPRRVADNLVPKFRRSGALSYFPPPPPMVQRPLVGHRPSSLFQSFTITLRHTTLGRTPLKEWTARPRDLYLITHKNQKRQTSMFRRDSNPQSQKARGSRLTS